jgi:hypothetical protein
VAISDFGYRYSPGQAALSHSTVRVAPLAFRASSATAKLANEKYLKPRTDQAGFASSLLAQR